MPEGNSDTPVDRRQQLEEWRRAKAAQQKGSSASNNMKTPTVAGKSTTPSFFFAKSTDTSKSTQKTATAPPKSRPAEQRPILNSASASASSSRSATLPKKRSSPTRPRIIAAQKASMSKSSVKVHGAGGSTIRAGQQQMPSRKPSGPRAITGTPRKPMGEPSNNADKTNSDELRRRVLRASAKKMAQIRREGGDLKMKLGLLSVHARLQEAEREKKQAKNNTVRSLNEELKAAKTQSSPSTMQKKHNESVIKQDSPRRSSPNDKFKNKTKNQNKNRKSAAGSIGNTANPANDNSETTTGHSSLSTEAAPLEERVSRLAKEEFDRINTIITNMHLYQPVALRVNKSTVEPISNAKLLGWFRVNDARIAAIQGEMKLARAMLWILGARPVQINTNGSNDGHTSKYVWPYQQTDYWIARGKFEEACGEINEAFYVYEEAMSVLPHSTDDFKHAHQEFTDRMARSGFYMDKNKPRASYPASDTNKSISARQRRDQLRAQLELVFKMPLPSSPSIISPMPNGDAKSTISSYSMSPPMEICCVQPMAQLTKSPAATIIANDQSNNNTASPQSREEKKRLAQASDDGQLSFTDLRALSLVPYEEGEDDDDDDDDDEIESSGSKVEQTTESANDALVVASITSDSNTNGAEDEASWESDEENNGPTIDSTQKTPEKQGNTRRRPRTPEETSPNERPLQRIRSTGNRRKQKSSDVLVSTFTALTPVRASKGQQSEYGVHTVISPVRRSTRLLPKEIEGIAPIVADTDADALASKSNDEQRLAQLLREQGFAYLPNKALSLSTVKKDKTAASTADTDDKTSSQS